MLQHIICNIITGFCLSVSGFKAALLQDSILPPVLKARSEGELVEEHTSNVCQEEHSGDVVELIFHHDGEMVSLSASGACRNLFSSASITCCSVRSDVETDSV